MRKLFFLLFIPALICEISNFSFAQYSNIRIINVDAQNYPLIKAEFIVKDSSGIRRDFSDPENYFTLRDGNIQRAIISDSCPEGILYLSVIIVMDISRSMDSLIFYDPPDKKRMDIEKQIVLSLINTLPKDRSECAVLAFDSMVETVIGFTSASKKYEIADSINTSTRVKPRGGTDFNVGFIEDNIVRRNPPHPGALKLAESAQYKPIIVFITDGNHDSNLNELKKDEIIQLANQVGATIHCIILGNVTTSILNDLTGIAQSTSPSGKIFVLNKSEGLHSKINYIIDELNFTYYPGSCFLSWETDCEGGMIDLTLNLPVPNAAKTIYKYIIPENIKPAKPKIRRSGDTLYSNYSSGNQWYFEREEISGASGNFHVPLFDGNYSVRIVQGYECISDFSDNFKYNSQTIETLPLESNELCAEASFNVSYRASGTFESDNVFFVQISNDNFVNFRNIGNVKRTTSGTITAELPEDLKPANNYRVRVSSYNPVIEGTDNGEDITVIEKPKYTLKINKGKNNRKYYETNENVNFILNVQNVNYESAVWNFGEGASPYEYSGFEPPEVSYSLPGLKDIAFNIVYSEKCNYTGSASTQVHILDCEFSIDSTACVDSIKINEDNTMWCKNNQIWILPTGSLTLLGAWNKIFILEPGGSLSLGDAHDCIIYLKPAASFSYKGEISNSALIKAPGSSGKMADSVSNKQMNCTSVIYNYTTAPKEGIEIMQRLGYLDVTEVNRNAISLFPNPASDKISVEFPFNHEGVRCCVDQSIEIYNILGEHIKNTKLEIRNGKFIIDVSDLQSGVYYIATKADGKSVVERFVVVR